MLGAVYCGRLCWICFSHKSPVQLFSCNLIINFSTLSLSLPLCLTLQWVLWGLDTSFDLCLSLGNISCVPSERPQHSL